MASSVGSKIEIFSISISQSHHFDAFKLLKTQGGLEKSRDIISIGFDVCSKRKRFYEAWKNDTEMHHNFSELAIYETTEMLLPIFLHATQDRIRA